MQIIEIKKEDLIEGTHISMDEEISMDEKICMDAKSAVDEKEAADERPADAGTVLVLAADGGGIQLPRLMTCRERYLYFTIEVLEEHSASFNLLVYGREEKEPAFDVRFGILPGVRTPICLDLEWFNAKQLFPEANAGALKIVCHGRRIEKEEIGRIVLSSLPAFHDMRVRISRLLLTDEYPARPELPDVKLVDELGQNKRKSWVGKVSDPDAWKKMLLQMSREGESGYSIPDWSKFGGWKKKKLKEGSGFFSSCKAEGRWWLVDPSGYAFFSMGPDCVGLGTDCRVDGIEKWMDWLPKKDAPLYDGMYRMMEEREGCRRKGILFSFLKSNLYRAFGENGYECWKKLVAGQLRRHGMNTLGNWSDEALFASSGMPYVTSLPEFPGTKKNIFRDFPDVFSEEYESNAARAAQALEKRKDDPLMIGYFLRNEPSWAFVDHLVLADEVLYNPERTACKEELVRCLKEKYGDIQVLNRAWSCSLDSFDALYLPQKRVSEWSQRSRLDMREFSRRMLRAYIEIPCRECRKVDPNHMILGMRWAWISDSDLVTGWENFDVFSINCYAVDPTSHIQHIADLGVDLPVLIGEFHFGALDRGPTATGLEGVKSQRDRGIAYRYYCERVAAHKNGVGCHYFQCYDQFSLGRFDGENYNIGLFDICLQPYTEMLEGVLECSREVYQVMAAQQEPVTEKAQSIPMIAY